VERVPSEFTVEYSCDPVPSARERYEAALDLIVRLILADLAQNPDDDGQTNPPDGVQ
jgi:hypothetical protein